MKRRKVTILIAAIASIVLLATLIGRQQANARVADPDTAVQQETEAGTSGDLQRKDDQGNVIVVVRPVNLNDPALPLAFEVEMNTHSVELDMDLASLATLTTDDGKRTAAATWDGSRGGHHVSGTLSFLDIPENGFSLESARTLNLTIANVDAAERVFQWNLP